jgi:hypothetical protein
MYKPNSWYWDIRFRDCYASTLQRNKISRDDISQMLGHSNVVVTEHYLDGLDSESTGYFGDADPRFGHTDPS